MYTYQFCCTNIRSLTDRKDTCIKVMTDFKTSATDTGKDISVCRGAFIRRLLWQRIQWMRIMHKGKRGIINCMKVI